MRTGVDSRRMGNAPAEALRLAAQFGTHMQRLIGGMAQCGTSTGCPAPSGRCAAPDRPESERRDDGTRTARALERVSLGPCSRCVVQQQAQGFLEPAFQQQQITVDTADARSPADRAWRADESDEGRTKRSRRVRARTGCRCDAGTLPGRRTRPAGLPGTRVRAKSASERSRMAGSAEVMMSIKMTGQGVQVLTLSALFYAVLAR